MNTQQQINEMAEQPSKRENELSLQGFMEHMKQKNVDIERDLLLMELASRLGLYRDLRFQYFIDHGKQHSKRDSCVEQPTIIEKYEKRLTDIAHDLTNEDWSVPEMQTFGSVVSMLQTLIVSGRINEVDQCFKITFPEYYH